MICRERIRARATALHEANVTVEVFPLVKPEQSFPMAFWNDIVHAGEDAETGTSFSEGADTLYRLQVNMHTAPTLAHCLFHAS